MNGLDLYTILGVDRHADEATILASYRRLAKLKHPDKNRDNPNATSEFQELNKAYSVLRDARLRRDYDQLHPSPQNAGYSFNTPPRAGPSSTGRYYCPHHSSSASAARAAAATAAENAKTPEQRRAQVDAALRASAARYAHIRHSQRRAFRFMRVPNSWEEADDAAATQDGAGGGPVPYEDPATVELQHEIHALRRLMQQRDAADDGLRCKQTQIGKEMDMAWATVAQQTALLNRTEAIRSDGPLYGLRAEIQKGHQQIKVLRDKTHAIAADLAASVVCRQAEDAKLKELTARYRATLFKKGDDQPPPNEVDPFDEWVAWEPPAHGKLWSDDDDDDKDKDGVDGDDNNNNGEGASDDEPDWIPFSTRDADMAVPKTPQWSPNAKAAEYVPEGKGKAKEPERKGKEPEKTGAAVNDKDDKDDQDHADGHLSDSTNVWNYASDDEKFNADLLRFESDDEMGGVLVGSDVGEDEEDEEILPSVERDYDYEEEQDSGELGDDEDSCEIEADNDDDDEGGGDIGNSGNNANSIDMNAAAADNDSTTGWYPDDDLDLDVYEAYTEKIQFSNGNWHAEFCREW